LIDRDNKKREHENVAIQTEKQKDRDNAQLKREMSR
jgi:hypothetical protein